MIVVHFYIYEYGQPFREPHSYGERYWQKKMNKRKNKLNKIILCASNFYDNIRNFLAMDTFMAISIDMAKHKPIFAHFKKAFMYPPCPSIVFFIAFSFTLFSSDTHKCKPIKAS